MRKLSANKIKTSQPQIIKNLYLISFLLGAVSATAFAPLYFIPLAIASFGGWFLLSNFCQNNRQSFFVGWWFGFGQFAFSLYWISISLFVDISKFFWLLPFALLLIPAVLAIYIGIVLLIVNFVCKKLEFDNWKKVLVLAFFWVLFEVLRANLFTGFPWNLLGYSLLFSLPLSQAASVIGVYGLSFIAVVFYCSSALFFKFEHKKIKFFVNQKTQPFLATIALIIALIWMAGLYRLHNSANNLLSKTLLPQATFRLVQPAIKQNEKWDQEYRYNSFMENIKLSHQAGFNKVNYVVWSESAVPYVINSINSNGLLAEISSVAPQNGYVITGALRAEFGKEGVLTKAWNTIFAIDSKSKVTAYYDKNHLVPFGEYVPFAQYVPFISKITDGSVGFSRGQGLKTIKLDNKTPSFSPLICYEAIFPNQVIDKSNSPNFLLNLTNDAWFGNSSGPYQHLDMVRMRAIEYGLPVIRVANSGISALIDPMGRVISSVPLNEKGFIDVKLMMNLPETFYSKISNF